MFSVDAADRNRHLRRESWTLIDRRSKPSDRSSAASAVGHSRIDPNPNLGIGVDAEVPCDGRESRSISATLREVGVPPPQ